MDSTSMDHYEKQLYTVFKTFDVDNEEALDRAAVLDLCDALQLEDRGAALVDTLFERPAERVTFTQFRNGLLSVLGGAPAPPAPPPPPAAPHSDDDSSGREVAPKFVVGAKKYGRRSRPPSVTASPRPPAPEAVRVEDESDRLKRRMKCKRSAHLMDGPGENSSSATPEPNSDLDHDRRIDYEQSLELCRSLHMDGIDRQLVEQIFQEATSNDITVGEFFDRLNASLTMSIASSCSGTEVAGEPSDEDAWGPGSALATDAVTEAWERAGVEHARRLLLELGFAAPTLRASELSRALDAELRTLAPPPPAPPDARALLLQAALALHRLRLAHAKQLVDASHAENAKLRNDLADANRRAQTLAQEVDENHARIEASLKGRIRQLESRHAEETRAAASEWAAERERAGAMLALLEQQVSRLAGEEARLRADASALRDQNQALSRRASLAEERVGELEAARLQLQAELRTLVSRRDEPAEQPGPGAELTARLDQLQLENKQLRDRNDELCAELEAAARGAERAGGAVGASWREEVAGAVRSGRPRDDSLASLHSTQNCTDECDQSLISLDQKVFDHIEVVRRLQGVLETVTQVSLSDDSGCESCGTLKGIITTIQERVQELNDSVILSDQIGMKPDVGLEAGVQTESQDVEQIDRLKKEMAEAEQKNAEERERLSNLVKDLETSLDQMKMEYDKCEEYWANKLNEERDIYAEEQKISDERLTELINKISEYEQQFAPKSNSSQLPTIDEKYSLELQFTDLEDEFEKYKQQKETELESKDDEINRLKEKIKVLQDRPITNGHSNVSSPIDYLWSQGTITSPYKNDKRCVRDYQNPAYVQNADCKEENVRCSSDSEREKPLSPIQRPPRSASAGALRDEVVPPRGEAGEPQMINCADLEGQLRQQAQVSAAPQSRCACATMEARCRHLVAALRHRQLCLDAVQQAARSDGAALRARVSAAEGAVAQLQTRLAAADLLVKDLYLENCQLAHHQTRLL